MPINLLTEYEKYKPKFNGSYWMLNHPLYYMSYLNQNGLEIAYLMVELNTNFGKGRVTYTTWQLDGYKHHDVYRFT